MEKIGLCHNDGKPIIGRMEYDEAVLKVNEIVEWINERDKERIEEYELMRKWIDKIDKWINKHQQARGEKKESRGEKINRLLKNKPKCEWGPGGEHDPK